MSKYFLIADLDLIKNKENNTFGEWVIGGFSSFGARPMFNQNGLSLKSTDAFDRYQYVFVKVLKPNYIDFFDFKLDFSYRSFGLSTLGSRQTR